MFGVSAVFMMVSILFLVLSLGLHAFTDTSTLNVIVLLLISIASGVLGVVFIAYHYFTR